MTSDGNRGGGEPPPVAVPSFRGNKGGAAPNERGTEDATGVRVPFMVSGTGKSTITPPKTPERAVTVSIPFASTHDSHSTDDLVDVWYRLSISDMSRAGHSRRESMAGIDLRDRSSVHAIGNRAYSLYTEITCQLEKDAKEAPNRESMRAFHDRMIRVVSAMQEGDRHKALSLSGCTSLDSVLVIWGNDLDLYGAQAESYRGKLVSLLAKTTEAIGTARFHRETCEESLCLFRSKTHPPGEERLVVLTDRMMELRGVEQSLETLSVHISAIIARQDEDRSTFLVNGKTLLGMGREILADGSLSSSEKRKKGMLESMVSAWRA